MEGRTAELRSGAAELFRELTRALVDEGLETGQFEMDSMRYPQMERLGHGVGQELSRQVQRALAERQGEQIVSVFVCPTCGRECVAERRIKPMTSLDGDGSFWKCAATARRA